jgi:hypothetical protein
MKKKEKRTEGGVQEKYVNKTTALATKSSDSNGRRKVRCCSDPIKAFARDCHVYEKMPQYAMIWYRIRYFGRWLSDASIPVN